MTDEASPTRARRRSREDSPGLVSALLGAALLMVAGFVLGVAAGLVLEEPGLFLDHAAGRTEAVSVEEGGALGAAAPGGPSAAGEALPLAEAPAEDEPAASPPPVAAAAPPPRAPEAPVASRGAEVPAIAPAPPRPAAAPAATGFSVQVGAFRDAEGAEQLVERLRRRGFRVYVATSAEAGDPRWRVRVGPVASRPEAEELATRLKQREGLPTWVLAEEG